MNIFGGVEVTLLNGDREHTHLDETYLAYPVVGSRQMARWLRRQGHPVNHKRVQRLMRLMGLEAIYQKPNLSRPNPEHRIYPYLLRKQQVVRPNQIWATSPMCQSKAASFISVR